MTEKETLIARLKELGVKLDREVNVTGTIQELTLRISELEEELDEDGEEGAEVSVASTTAGSTSASPAQRTPLALLPRILRQMSLARWWRLRHW